VLVELAGWSSGHFWFDRKGPGPRPAWSLEPPVDLGAQWLEVLRRRDVVHAVTAECRQRRLSFEAADARQAAAAGLSPRARRLLELIGREADIDGIYEAFHQARHEALEATRELVKALVLLPRAAGRAAELERTFWKLPPDPDAPEEEVEFLWEDDAEDTVPGPVSTLSRGEGPAERSLSATEPAAVRIDPGLRGHPARASAGELRPGPDSGLRDALVVTPDHELRHQVRILTEGLDELIPGLSRYERWKRRLTFVATALALALAAGVLLALSLGWHRPYLQLLDPWLRQLYERWTAGP
jgi:hypothetical protein